MPLSSFRLNHGLPGSQTYPEVMQGTTELHDQIVDTGLPQTEPVFHDATAFDAAVDMLDATSAMMEDVVGQLLLQGQFLTAGFLGRHEQLHLGQGERQEAQILQEPTAGRQRIRRCLSNALVMHVAAVGVAEKEDGEWRIDQQDIFDRVVFFLAAITVFLFSRVLGADDAPFRAVMGKRGEAVTAAPGLSAAGPGASGSGVTTGATTAGVSSSSGVTTAAASPTVTPSCWAKAASERVGASPRVRKAVRSTGRRTWIH
jgi:hypothetical protein